MECGKQHNLHRLHWCHQGLFVNRPVVVVGNVIHPLCHAEEHHSGAVSFRDRFTKVILKTLIDKFLRNFLSWREMQTNRILCHSFNRKERYNKGHLIKALNVSHEIHYQSMNMYFSVISLLHVQCVGWSLSQYEEISMMRITCMIGQSATRMPVSACSVLMTCFLAMSMEPRAIPFQQAELNRRKYGSITS